MTDRWLYQALQAGRDEAMDARRKCYLSIMEKIRGEASRSLQEEMGEWRLYEYASKPRPTLRIMVRDNRAAATIILRADRTLQVRQPSWLGKNTRWFYARRKWLPRPWGTGIHTTRRHPRASQREQVRPPGCTHPQTESLDRRPWQNGGSIPGKGLRPEIPPG